MEKKSLLKRKIPAVFLVVQTYVDRPDANTHATYTCRRDSQRAHNTLYYNAYLCIVHPHVFLRSRDIFYSFRVVESFEFFFFFAQTFACTILYDITRGERVGTARGGARLRVPPKALLLPPDSRRPITMIS